MAPKSLSKGKASSETTTDTQIGFTGLSQHHSSTNMDPIRQRISSARNTSGGSIAPGDLARYHAPASFIVAPVPPTPNWPLRRIPRAIPADDPIAIA